MRVLVAAIIVTVVWAAMDRIFGAAVDSAPVNLITTFCAAWAGAFIVSLGEEGAP